jgi:hypothetical protein
VHYDELFAPTTAGACGSGNDERIHLPTQATKESDVRTACQSANPTLCTMTIQTGLGLEMNDVAGTVHGRSRVGSHDEPAVLIDAVGDAFHAPLRA